MIIIDEFEQRSREWFDARRGVITASGFNKLITSTGKPSKQAMTYLCSIAAETIVDPDEDDYKSPWMERGVNLEPEARQVLEFAINEEIKEVAIVFKDENRRVACSPDGIIFDGDKPVKGVELKCVKPSTQAKYIYNNKTPVEYVPQVQFSLWLTGMKEWVFCSYCPGMKPFIIIVEPEEELHEIYDETVDGFVEKLDSIIKKIS